MGAGWDFLREPVGVGVWGVQTGPHCPSSVGVRGDWSDSKHWCGQGRAGQGRDRLGCVLPPWAPVPDASPKGQINSSWGIFFSFLFFCLFGWEWWSFLLIINFE